MLLKLKRTRYAILRTAFSDNLGFSLVSQLVKYPPAMQETLVQSLSGEDTLKKEWATHSSILERPWFDSWVRKIHWRRALPMPVFLGFPSGSIGRESTCNAGDLGSTPGLGRSSGTPLQCSCLENPMDRGAWGAKVHGVANGQSIVCMHVNAGLPVYPSPLLSATHLFSMSASLFLPCE